MTQFSIPLNTLNFVFVDSDNTFTFVYSYRFVIRWCFRNSLSSRARWKRAWRSRCIVADFVRDCFAHFVRSQWHFLFDTSLRYVRVNDNKKSCIKKLNLPKVIAVEGLEPTTHGLWCHCSTTELHRLFYHNFR